MLYRSISGHRRIKHTGPQEILVESIIPGEFRMKGGEQMEPLSYGDDAARAVGIVQVITAVGRAMLCQPGEDL